jgi:hypothetical protein
MSFGGSQISPKVWALVVVLSGSLLSTAFLRSSSANREIESHSRSNGPLSSWINISDSGPVETVGSHKLFSSQSSQTSTSFPEWARQPSALDALINQPLSLSGPPDSVLSSGSSKPTPYRIRTEGPSEGLQYDSRAGVTDELKGFSTTPFAEATQLGMNTKRSDQVDLVWPDSSLEQHIANRQKNNAILPASSKAAESRNEFSALKGFTGEELPKARLFDQSSNQTNSERTRAIGARLSSELPPDPSKYIFQPGIGK